MVFENYLLPVMPNHTKSILDYHVQIRNLRPEATFFIPAETGKKLTFPYFFTPSLIFFWVFNGLLELYDNYV